ncbi:hypothetical protein N9F21_01915 [Porticoccaceae bacterium]|nr:hypothetical protein [Porticoccaceae bacterium]
MHKKRSGLAITPLIVNSILVLSFIWIWIFYNPKLLSEPISTLTPTVDWELPNASSTESSSLASFITLTEKPLFHQTRKPAVLKRDVEPKVPDTRTKIDDFQLKGIVYKGKQENVAYIYNRLDSNDYRVRQGEQIAGWQIVEITRNEVRLVRDEQSGSLSLFANTYN